MVDGGSVVKWSNFKSRDSSAIHKQYSVVGQGGGGGGIQQTTHFSYSKLLVPAPVATRLMLRKIVLRYLLDFLEASRKLFVFNFWVRASPFL